MSLDRVKKLGFLVSILCFNLAFSFYNAFPSFLTSIFFPVNNSLFEVIKVIISGTLISLFIQWFILENNHVKVKNPILSIFITILFNCLLFFIFYMPICLMLEKNYLVNICFFIIISLFNQFIFYNLSFLKVTNKKDKIEYISLIGIIIIYIILGILTYFPLINDLFFDESNNKFGINTFII